MDSGLKPVVSWNEVHAELEELGQVLDEHDRLTARARFESDLFAFSVEACGIPLIEAEDRAFCAALMELVRGGAPRMLYVRPRETAKTLIGAEAFPLWCITRDRLEIRTGQGIRAIPGKNIRMLILSEVLKLAGEAVQNHYHRVRSASFQRYYPEVSLHAAKTVTHGYVVSTRDSSAREPTCQAAGMDVEITGGHFDLGIADDVVTVNTTQNAMQLRKTDVRMGYYTPMLKGGALAMYGTYYHDLDHYHQIIRRQRKAIQQGRTPLYQIHVESVITRPETVPIHPAGYFDLPLEAERYAFPVRYPREVLEQIQDGMDVPTMASQYLSIIIPEGYRIFSERHFSFLETAHLPKVFNRYIITDTATVAHEDGCRSVMIVVDIQPSGRAVVMDYWAAPVIPSGFLDQLFAMARQWRPIAITLEKVTLNNVFRGYLEERLASRSERVSFSIIDIDDRMVRTKDQRIRAVEPLMRSGQIVFAKSILEAHPGFYDDFMREFLLYQSGNMVSATKVRGQLCDIPDALSDVAATDPKSGVRYLIGPPEWTVEVEEYAEVKVMDPETGGMMGWA